MLRFKKALNNNIVLAFDENDTEVILVGTGIGFHGRSGTHIDEKRIKKIYRVAPHEKISQYLEDIPIAIIETTEVIIQEGITILEKQINTSILLALADHLKFSIERVEKGIKIYNPLKWEIPHLYPKEFAVGKGALKIIRERLGTELPDDEAAYIALHFVNAQFENQNIVKTIEITEVITTIIGIVNYNFHIQLTEKNLSDSRFITHLHYLVMRQNDNKPHTPLIDESLFSVVRNNYPKSYQCANKIKEYLMDKYHWVINEDELVYLVIHIEKILLSSKNLQIKCND